MLEKLLSHAQNVIIRIAAFFALFLTLIVNELLPPRQTSQPAAPAKTF
jgi:hypothetical protein